MKNISSTALRTGVSILAALVLSLTPGLIIPAVQAAPAAQASKKVDVNNADEKTLETLPGIGPALAERIIENRPYKKLADLEKVPGLTKTKVDALKGQVSFGKVAAAKKGKESAGAATGKETKSGKETTTGKAPATSPTGRINVNTADAKTLETLPGIGPTLAQRIIDNRPYKSADDLKKVKGLSQSELSKIQDQITFGPTTRTRTGPTTTTKESPSTATSEGKGKAPQVGGTESPTSPTGRAVEQLAPGEKININTATAEQLDKLYGIGSVKAQAIIEYRQEHGGFKSIDEIKNVKGIKEGEYDKIKDHISVR